MRERLDKRRVEQLLAELGRAAKGPGRVYLTGGTSAVLVGWRLATIDADLRLDPEPAGIFEAIAAIKERLHMNVELASPLDFLPPVPGWADRCQFIGRFGEVDAFHFDFVSQALAKVERGHERDMADVRAMLAMELVDAVQLREAFSAIRPGLIRFPAIDVEAFAANLAEASRDH